jgi:ADP-ribosylglycohydrolase|tara:strand:+ start:359 stop:1420 length:1062 start_codon:yes stop_codon:yes gene_type:complete
MVGNTIGDAFGGVVEFAKAERVKKVTGKLWADEFLPYAKNHGTHPLGVWEAGPPRGTGTDDTRNNQIFVECVIRNSGRINSQFLAIEYIQRYRDRKIFYPDHEELAERHYGGIYNASCAYLGMTEAVSANPLWVTLAKGNGFPSLWGLISLGLAGLLYQNEPAEAYRKTFELDFMDIGYARDATAMMAAMISAALGGGISGREMIEIGLQTDPFGYGQGRLMANRFGRFRQIADQAESDETLIDALAPEVMHLHAYDPIDVLGVPLAAIYYSDGDPIRTIVMAANDRDLDENGDLKQLRDVDCTAGVAGALVGALAGIEGFPDDWVKDTVEANKAVYGIDLEENARLFCESVF